MSGVLLVLLAAASAVATPSLARAQAAGPAVTIVDPAAARFEPTPNIPPCFRASVLRGDPARGESVILVKGTAGCSVPTHWHSANEELGMVAGAARLAMKDGKAAVLKPGAYAYVPARHQHVFTCQTACTFFVVSDAALDTHYVDAAGNEISMQEALKASPAARPKRARQARTK